MSKVACMQLGLLGGVIVWDGAARWSLVRLRVSSLRCIYVLDNTTCIHCPASIALIVPGFLYFTQVPQLQCLSQASADVDAGFAGHH